MIDVELTVTPSQGGSPQTIAGSAHFTGDAHGKLLQLAIHGITYDRRYWHVPRINGAAYSYADFMAERGDVVLAIDQLGAGKSSRPDGDSVGLVETARAVASLVEQFRSPSNPLGTAFDRIVLVGQSFGGLTAVRAQAIAGNADGLVVTGWLHGAPPPGDPKAFEPFLAQPYVTLPAAMRQAVFYHAPGSDPDLVKFDAELNTPFTRAQFKDLIAASTTPSSARLAADVRVPVLVQVGRHDALMGGSDVARDARHYTNSPAVTAIELPGAGHNVALHSNRLEGWNYIDRWLDQYCR
jgi:pimeloyl-ACP methyl ester carboxylesterase